MSKVSKAEPSPSRKSQKGLARRVHKSRLALVALYLYWPAIFIISHIPKRFVPPDVEVSGKILHIAAYFVLTLLVFLNAGLICSTSLRLKKTWLLVGLIAAYAAVDELLQLYIEGRHGSPVDWTTDMVACLFCVGLLVMLAKRVNSRA